MLVDRLETDGPLALGLREYLAHLIGMRALKRGWRRFPSQRFFGRSTRLYTVGQSVKRNLQERLDSAARARFVAEKAAERGLDQESGALFVVNARLVFNAFSISHLFHEEYEVHERRRVYLRAFESLTSVRALPQDDSEYWQDKLAQAAGSLFFMVGSVPYAGADGLRSLEAVEQMAASIGELAPFRAESAAAPMRFADSYPGGPARLQAYLAHMEAQGGRPANALKRVLGALACEIEDREDRIYLLALGLAAARASEQMEVHTALFAQLAQIVETARQKYVSVEGRLFEMQDLFHDFNRGLEVWPTTLWAAEDLLAVSEMLKARVLLDDMNSGRAPRRARPITFIPTKDPDIGETSSLENEHDDLSPAERAQLQTISIFPIGTSAGLTTTNPKLDFFFQNHQSESDELQRRDRLLREDGVEAPTSSSPLGSDALRTLVADGELLIEFLIPRDRFAVNRDVWTIVTDGRDFLRRGLYVDALPHLNTLIGGVYTERGPLSDMAAIARAAILARDDGAARETLRRFFDFLIDPLIAAGYEPERYRRWIFVLHGPLHLIPMHALVDEQGRHLIERVAITTVPSASIMDRMVRPRAPVGRLLSIGNPTPPDSRFHDLRDAEDEAQRIPALLGDAIAATVLTGANATEARIIQDIANAEIVHIAAHAELDARDPMDGHRIIIASDTMNDGYLHASEVRQLPLQHVRLVVLNVCDGAVCRYGPGDEPLGLLAAFVAAGTENVLGGLWELSDAASKLFILDFYRHLRASDPAEARRRAALEAIRRKRDLVFWAGFELIGPARPIMT